MVQVKASVVNAQSLAHVPGRARALHGVHDEAWLVVLDQGLDDLARAVARVARVTVMAAGRERQNARIHGSCPPLLLAEPEQAHVVLGALTQLPWSTLLQSNQEVGASSAVVEQLLVLVMGELVPLPEQDDLVRGGVAHPVLLDDVGNALGAQQNQNDHIGLLSCCGSWPQYESGGLSGRRDRRGKKHYPQIRLTIP